MKLLDLNIFKNEKCNELNAFNLETLAFTAAQSYSNNKEQIRIVFSSLYEAQMFNSFLQDYLDSENIYYYLFDEVLRVDFLGVSKEMEYERLRTINALAFNKPGVVIFNAIAFARPSMPLEIYKNNTVVFKRNDEYSHRKIQEIAIRNGYVRTNKVEHPGEYAIRGMIFDMFPPNYTKPFRLEFDGDRIEDIRSFDVQEEISVGQLEEACCTLARELLYDINNKEEIINHLTNDLKDIHEYDDLYIRLQNKISLINNSEDDGEVPLNHHNYFGTYHGIGFNNLKFNCYHIEDVYNKIVSYIEEDREYFAEQIASKAALKEDSLVVKDDIELLTKNLIQINENENNVLKTLPYTFESFYSLSSILNEMVSDGLDIYIVQEEGRINSLIESLRSSKIDFSIYPTLSKITLVNGSLYRGFYDEKNKRAFIGNKEIYGLSSSSARFLTRYKDAKTIKHYDDLNPGDYVVHEIHGIGKYVGVVKKDGMDRLLVTYRNDDRLYIPLVQFGMLKKYAGREGYAPSLDVLGGSTWARRKSKIKSRLTYLTDQLLEISSKRKAEKGFAFPNYPELEEDFYAAFPYELTTSQKRAFEAIENDMNDERPMDRLISGDVGFGKTELAFRAAYKAYLSGKQVVMLCPTTLLAKQHYEVAIQRFKGFGLHMACFSRLIPASEQKKNIERIKDGKIDLIIGTHRLLSDDITFNNLGLLIVDEEQRFGVAQKEKIKKIGGNIDVLTLTATPIPRTLQMSLLGVRELSTLDEPPLNRLPIKTYVTTYNDGIVKEAIDLELGRKGQVYYLHNKINTIYSAANKLKKMFPYAKIGIAHGKMNTEDETEVMNAFYDGNIDILVCTTIIETGLDIANVNTIIIEDATRYGLAQLYQIKGRVGRSDRLAYAYLFYNKFSDLSDDARKRLKSIKEFTELGSGYKIAKQDLNIRGAGDILGAEQAGFMDTLGYDSYQALLDEVIKQKKEVHEAKSNVLKNRYALSFNLDCCIPEDYADEKSRINIYRELSNINSIYEINKFTKKLRDVYGTYPLEVYNLLVKRQIEVMLESPLIDSFVEGLDYYLFTFSEKLFQSKLKLKDIDEILKPLEKQIRVNISHNHLLIRLRKSAEYLNNLYYITNNLIGKIDETIG